MNKLRPKQQRFVEEYLIDLNATQAAIRAGYSKRTARAIAAENLQKPDIVAALQQKMVERSERTEIDSDWVLARLAAEVDADIADLFQDDQRLLPVKEWPKIWRTGLVSGLDVTQVDDQIRVTKIKLSDRVARLKLIGDHVRVKAFEKNIGEQNNTQINITISREDASVL